MSRNLKILIGTMVTILVALFLVSLVILGTPKGSNSQNTQSGAVAAVVTPATTLLATPQPTPTATASPSPAVTPLQAPAKPLPPTPPIDPNWQQEGALAIKPEAGLAAGSGPAFSEATVRDFVSKHPMAEAAMAMTSKKAAAPQINKVEFLLSQEADKELNKRTSLEKDRQICLVTMSGTFVVTNPFGGSSISSRAFQIFDAHTGNLLVEGVLN